VEARIRQIVPMLYPDGTEIQVNDLVWWNDRTKHARIAAIVQSNADILKYGVGNSGVFLSVDPLAPLMNDVFYEERFFVEEEIMRVE
jgi:hypothetical protein